MICPHCNYQHGWSNESLDNIEGQNGDFYQLPVKLERTDYYTDHVSLYACPECLKTFISKD